MMQQEIIIAGFGGQGILSAGKLLTYAGMVGGKQVSWLPSYGPEMRGGTANCNVIISDVEVGSPVLNSANSLIVMNGPSLEKFENAVVKGGLIIIDSSLVERKCQRKDVEVIEIPATKIALDMGNPTFAAVVLIGKLIAKTGIIKEDDFKNALYKVLPEKKHYMIPEEMVAVNKGMTY